jgi:hypothetical protein
VADPVEYIGALGGLAGLALAAVAAWYAKRSSDATDRAVSLARDEVEMARAEHAEFLRQLQARAKFQFTVRPTPEPGDDGVIRVDATVACVTVEIGLRNVGERAAGETLVNAIAPRDLREFRWSGPHGEVRPDDSDPAETREELTDDDGRVYPGQYLDKELPRVTRRPYYVTWVTLMVEVPAQGVRSVPLRFTAEADELPDEEPLVSETLMLRVGKVAPEPT